jgi:hypothetical protein
VTQPRRKRFWFWYFGVFLTLVSLSFAYGLWRESTLEPVITAVNVRSSGTYRTHTGVLRFHSSLYHPEFHIVLSEPTDERWWPEGDQTLKIWDGTPPLIDLEIRDSTGATVLKETGPVSASNGWTVTGGGRAGETYVAVYKLHRFKASPFRSYTATMRIIESSPSAAVASAEFCVSAIKAYALLPNVLLTLFLASLMLAGAPVVFVARWILARRFARA